MQPTQTTATNGRSSSSVEDVLLRLELEQRRAICARQAMVIEQLNEDVAMFRRAVVALTAQRAHRYGGGQRGRERADGPPAALPDRRAEPLRRTSPPGPRASGQSSERDFPSLRADSNR